MRRCELCDETGQLTVWHPEMVKRALTSDEPIPLKEQRECAVPCKCTVGDKYATWTKRDKNGTQIDVPRFVERWWHCRRTYRSREEGYHDPRLDVADQGIQFPNYEKGFDEFNES